MAGRNWDRYEALTTHFLVPWLIGFDVGDEPIDDDDMDRKHDSRCKSHSAGSSHKYHRPSGTQNRPWEKATGSGVSSKE